VSPLATTSANEKRNPAGVELLFKQLPRVAAKRDNPGLSYVTALRLVCRSLHKVKTHLAIVVVLASILVFIGRNGRAQEFLPAPPPDRSLIYTLDDQNKLVPLPFEQGQTPLRPETTAKSTRVSYIELKGEHSLTVFKTATPRVFLFTYERPGVHPPFLVWLTPHKGARRVTAIAQRGLSGFAISSEEIVKPTVRGLVKDGDLVFMEIRPRTSLIPGEYAIIGDDLAHIATFRVITAAGN
jgi:hypothetical protein